MANEMARYASNPQPAKFRLVPKLSKLEKRNLITGLLFISPWIVGFVVFLLYPIAASAYYSLTSFTPVGQARFIGLQNYQQLLTSDPLFVKSLANTAYYALFSIPLSNILAFGLAALLNSELAGQSFFRIVFYLPSILPVVAKSIVWIWLLHPQYGIVTAVLQAFGLPAINWFTDANWAKPGLILMNTWSVGGMMLLYLAALQHVPVELYEAASLDGAGSYQRMWKITLPMISPVILFNVVISLIGTFQYFTEAAIITNGGPGDATLFYSMYLYKNAFAYFKMGYASAMAWILFVIILGFTLIIFKTSAKRIYYQDS
mgnify:CR=1 FL=1